MNLRNRRVLLDGMRTRESREAERWKRKNDGWLFASDGAAIRGDTSHRFF